MADITVTTLIDENDGIVTGDVSLRDAINAAASGDRIIFDSSLANGTITLSNGELIIVENLTIDGDTDDDPDTRNITVDADGNSRVLRVDDGDFDRVKTVTIDGLTVTGGVSSNSFSFNSGSGIYNRENLTVTNSTISGNSSVYGTGGILNSFDAVINISNSIISDNISNNISNNNYYYYYSFSFGTGGIENRGTATISNSTISGNTTTNYYGAAGIYNSGTTTISNSIISSNSASSRGGGIDSTGIVSINNSTISGNTASRGGGISNGRFFFSYGTVSISNSTISDNSARYGGGIDNRDVLEISNSTISGNTAVRGGGVWNEGFADISNSTISGNTAVRDGGGFYNFSSNYSFYSGGTANIVSTIIATNTAQDNPDVDGDFIDQGNNLIGDATGSTSFTTSTWVGDADNPINPLLGPLADNGGSTLTQALLLGSPAIEAGSNPDELTTDQRGDGFVREFMGQRADIGAFEFQPDDLPIPLDDPAEPEDVGFITDENTLFTTDNVLINDIDPQSNELSVAGFDTTETQGVVTNNSDGTFDYNPDGQFEFLAAGEIATDRFTYTIEDGASNPGIFSAIVNITIQGVNDAPTVRNPIANQTAIPSNVFSFVIPADTFNDVDNGDVLTLSAFGLPNWLIFDPNTVTFNGVPTSVDAGSRNTITVRATDSLGANVSREFNLIVDGTFTAPIILPPTSPTLPTPPTLPTTPQTPTIIVPPSNIRVDPSIEVPRITEPDIEPNQNPAETLEVIASADPAVGSEGSDNIMGSNAPDVIFGQQGADFMDGENGSDTIYGGQGNDQILGGLANDSIFGNSGNDTITGSEGNDWINGNQNNDWISGEEGSDTVFGGRDNDTLLGGEGRDQLFGNRGEDLIEGGSGNDSLYGGQQADTISGNEGNDFVSGDNGSDLLDGNTGEDTLIGGIGDDVLDGGEDDDNLEGGEGNDELIGAGGNDIIRGDGGSDRFILSPGDGTDIILDFQNGTDFLLIDGGLTFDDLVLMQENSNIQLLFNGEILAILNGVNIGDLTTDDFITTI